jgi:hypothetical protein
VSLDRSIDPLERTVGFPKRQMHLCKADGRHVALVDSPPQLAQDRTSIFLSTG